MRISKPIIAVLLFAGTFAMAFFGSRISRAIGQSDPSAGSLLLPGYSIGLIVISGAMSLRLNSRVKDLETKLQQLESKDTPA